jgi:hypothetical protein
MRVLLIRVFSHGWSLDWVRVSNRCVDDGVTNLRGLRLNTRQDQDDPSSTSFVTFHRLMVPAVFRGKFRILATLRPRWDLAFVLDDPFVREEFRFGRRHACKGIQSKA